MRAPSPWPRRWRALRAAGLAQGGSLANAVVVDGPLVLNPGGLRRPDEFVRHKLLDVVGDLALAGAPLRGRFTGHRSGHALNNRLLRALFADAANWRWSPTAGRAGRGRRRGRRLRPPAAPPRRPAPSERRAAGARPRIWNPAEGVLYSRSRFCRPGS